MVGRQPGAQIAREALPIPLYRRRRSFIQRRRMPLLRLATSEIGILFLAGAEHVARRMAGAAMGKPVDQIGAVVPLRRPVGVGLKALVFVEQELPAGKQRAELEGKVDLGRRRLVAHRLTRHQIGVDRPQIVVGRPGELIIGKRRIEVAALTVDALAHRTDEGLLRPVADAGIGVGRDIGAVNDAVGRVHRIAAGIGSPAWRGMAVDAVAERGEPCALGDKLLVECGGCRPIDWIERWPP
jgi:hypothetical protein